MRRILLLIVALAIAAFAGWYYWNLSQRISSAPVSALLPRETIFLAHMPDFNRSLDEWHHCDIYQLYREPSVQDFLRKPLANLPTPKAFGAQTLQEIEQLDPKHAFLALTSMDGNNPKFVGGFRFRGSQQEAERIISRWRSALSEQTPAAKREKLQYQRHEIELVTVTPFTLATTYDRPWFFAATNLADLKALLDRADHRARNPETTLDKDEAYRVAVSHRPSNYATFFYLQPKTFSERLAALRAAVRSTPTPGETTMLEKMRCIAGSMRFDNGKIHDVLFLGMPKLERETKLTRSSLSLGTKETFFYLSMLLNLGEKIDTLNQAAALAGTKLFQALADSGITADDWKAAFGLELGSLADWPSSAHWPSFLLTLPVIDAAKAGKITDVLIRSDEGAIWTRTEKDGVHYFSKQSAASLVAITPTVALSNRMLIAGFNPVSVEEAMKRSGTGSDEFSDSQTYKAAERLLPEPTNFFAYIDTALLYSRLDATLRPMLLMAAAFMPAVAGSIDVGKLPSPEVITKHLSPIISSQRYDHDGYVAESLGPITLDQSAIGVAILSSLGTAAARQKTGAGLSGWSASPAATPQVAPTPSPTP
ncbi:MAG TPA: hypothetical protein VNE84_04485 [Candidatus Limnocylindria bacterium]|jgi:hypothetical protein|nr:hypothetical protein [Candidatus Limnocylindria bacterium]